MPRIGPRQAAVFAAVGAPLMALPLLLSAAPQAPNDDQRPVSQRRSSASRGDDGARDASKSRLREGTRIEVRPRKQT